MANNRMYLVNKRTGARVFLAKYYPNTGWYTVGEISPHLDEAFDVDVGYGGTYGERWDIEYEVEPEQ